MNTYFVGGGLGRTGHLFVVAGDYLVLVGGVVVADDFVFVGADHYLGPGVEQDFHFGGDEHGGHVVLDLGDLELVGREREDEGVLHGGVVEIGE